MFLPLNMRQKFAPDTTERIEGVGPNGPFTRGVFPRRAEDGNGLRRAAMPSLVVAVVVERRVNGTGAKHAAIGGHPAVAATAAAIAAHITVVTHVAVVVVAAASVFVATVALAVVVAVARAFLAAGLPLFAAALFATAFAVIAPATA